MPIVLPNSRVGVEDGGSTSKLKQVLSQTQSTVLHRRISFHKAEVDEAQHNSKYIPLNTPTTKNDTNTVPQDSSTKKVAEPEHAVNPDGFQPPKRYLFPMEKVDALIPWNKVQGIGSGLNNHGNTCFLNSVIQCLVYTPPLANYLLSKEHSKTCMFSPCVLSC